MFFCPADSCRILPVVLRYLSLVPAAYVFLAVQYSAITIPFWDHTELVSWIASWYDGTFEVSSLWAPHNHSRPLTYRAVMLLNAVLTKWDIRSEYVYMYAAIYATFICHIWALHRLTKDSDPLIPSIALLVISLLIFSPAGHNNHWWSMMFQLNVANLFIAFGLLVTVFNPRQWSSHILGASSCWLAAYSLTNGLIVFLVLIVTMQLCAQNPMRPDRWTVFWILNFATVLTLYIPGIHFGSDAPHPAIGELAWFSLAYLGAPLGSIIWFPFKGQFDIPVSTTMNGLLGCILIGSASLFIWHAKERVRGCHPAALLLVGSTLFSVGSAAVTAWGRATFDAYGISNANSSRYTIFGVYLLLGQIYYVSSGYSQGWLPMTFWRGNQWSPRLTALGLVTFILCGSITYVRAVRVYVDAHNFNHMLANAYTWGLEPTGLEKYIHPSPDAVTKLKRELQRLQLGPYASMPQVLQVLSIGIYQRPFLLFDERRLTQRFRASYPGLKAIAVTMITGSNKQAGYQVAWQAHDVTDGMRYLIAANTFNAKEVSDWQSLRLQLPYLADSRGHLYELEFSAPGKSGDQQTVGLALYSMDEAQTALEQAAGMGELMPERLTLALRLEYVK